MYSPRLYKYRDSNVLYKPTVHTFGSVNFTHTLLVQTHTPPWRFRPLIIVLFKWNVHFELFLMRKRTVPRNSTISLLYKYSLFSAEIFIPLATNPPLELFTLNLFNFISKPRPAGGGVEVVKCFNRICLFIKKNLHLE